MNTTIKSLGTVNKILSNHEVVINFETTRFLSIGQPVELIYGYKEQYIKECEPFL